MQSIIGLLSEFNIELFVTSLVHETRLLLIDQNNGVAVYD